jgi:hypothetical protein
VIDNQLLPLLHLQVPCSLLAILGECAQELGDIKGATEYYQELVDRVAFGVPGVGVRHVSQVCL